MVLSTHAKDVGLDGSLFSSDMLILPLTRDKSRTTCFRSGFAVVEVTLSFSVVGPSQVAKAVYVFIGLGCSEEWELRRRK